MTPPVLVVVAHGTSHPDGPVVMARLSQAVGTRLPGVEVRVAYADVIEPSLASVLADVAEPCVVVPLFLAAGYHVRVDIPGVVASAGVDAVVSAPLGPAPEVVTAVAERLRDAVGGAGPWPDAVVLAAAGSSDARALDDVTLAAERLASTLDRPVTVGYVTTASPTVAEAVASARVAGPAGAAEARRVGVASYLLAPGTFQARLAEAGADVVADPIGAHPAVAGLVAERYRSAVAGRR